MKAMPQHDPIPSRQLPGDAPGGIANPHAWARYRRIMRWMTLLAIVCVALTLAVFRWMGGPTPLPMMIATAVGVFMTIMVGTGLMSLLFLSAGSGHDADVADFQDERRR